MTLEVVDIVGDLADLDIELGGRLSIVGDTAQLDVMRVEGGLPLLHRHDAGTFVPFSFGGHVVCKMIDEFLCQRKREMGSMTMYIYVNQDMAYVKEEDSGASETLDAVTASKPAGCIAGKQIAE